MQIYHRPFKHSKTKASGCRMTFYLCWKNIKVFFSPIKHGNMSCENYFLEWKLTFEHRCKTKHFSHILSTNNIGKLFFTTKSWRTSKNCICYTSSFLKRSFTSKNLEIKFPNKFDLFFHSFLSFFFSTNCLLLPQIFWQLDHDLHPHVILKTLFQLS